MADDWMPNISLPLTAEQFKRLPRNPAYRYDYLHGTAYLSPRPKHFHGVLDFAGWRAPDPDEISPEIRIRPLLASDQAELAEVFAAAFEGVQPFGGLASSSVWRHRRLPWKKPGAAGTGRGSSRRVSSPSTPSMASG